LEILFVDGVPNKLLQGLGRLPDREIDDEPWVIGSLDAGGAVALSVGQPSDETGRAFCQTVDRLQRVDELGKALAIDVINRDPNVELR
jgi:hypothetical protein